MAAHDFEFGLHVDAGESASALSDAVAAELARHLGFVDAAAAQLIREINVAVAEICGKGKACQVRFHATAGQLEVVVSNGPHATRHFHHRIP